MQIITLAQVKDYIGITTTDHDAAITAILPLVDAKVKEITRRNWTLQVRANLYSTEYAELRTVGTDQFADAYPSASRSVGIDWSLEDIADYVAAGYEIAGDGIPGGTYITDVYRIRLTKAGRTYTAPVVELSESATATGSRDAVIGFNRAYHPIVAKLAWWMIQDQSTDTPAGSIASESIGDISVSYSGTGAELDGRYGVPQWAVRGLPRYGRGY